MWVFSVPLVLFTYGIETEPRDKVTTLQNACYAQFIVFVNLMWIQIFISSSMWLRCELRQKYVLNLENRNIDQRNRAQRMLNSERHVQDLIDLSEFNEEDEKGIDVPFFDLESILIATNNFSNENKLGEGGYGPVYKVISATFIGH